MGAGRTSVKALVPVNQPGHVDPFWWHGIPGVPPPIEVDWDSLTVKTISFKMHGNYALTEHWRIEKGETEINFIQEFMFENLGVPATMHVHSTCVPGPPVSVVSRPSFLKKVLTQMQRFLSFRSLSFESKQQ